MMPNNPLTISAPAAQRSSPRIAKIAATTGIPTESRANQWDNSQPSPPSRSRIVKSGNRSSAAIAMLKATVNSTTLK